MHTITLKSDDAFFEMLTEMTKKLNTTRSELIRRAVMHYKDEMEKELLKEQIQKASIKVREHSRKVSQELEDTLEDGL